MQPVVSFRNVVKRFGNKNVLDNLSFDVYDKEIFGLIGESGAGKTTLLRTLMGFYAPDSGTIYSFGQDLVKHPEIMKQRFGFSSQDNCFYQDLTPMENLKYFGKLYKLKSRLIKQRSEFLLKMVGLWDAKDRPAHDLSGGMQRRLDLCCALLHEPKILIMDEPTTGLDPMLRKQMWILIQKINASGVTIIISSHLLNEMEQFCTSVAMLKDGRILGRGTPDQLKNLYSRNEEIHLETHPGGYKYIVQKLTEKGVKLTYVRHEGHKVVMYTPNAESALHAIAHTLEELKEKLLDIEINKPSLSEVFEALSRYKPPQQAQQAQQTLQQQKDAYPAQTSDTQRQQNSKTQNPINQVQKQLVNPASPQFTGEASSQGQTFDKLKKMLNEKNKN